jgi:hypothetical protein
LSLIFAQQPSTDQVLFSVASLLLSLSYQVPACLAKLVRSSQSAANIHNNLLSLLVIGGGQLVLAILPFSNSFIIYEADVLRFAIQSLVLIVTVRLLHLYRLDGANKSKIKMLTITLLESPQSCKCPSNSVTCSCALCSSSSSSA